MTKRKRLHPTIVPANAGESPPRDSGPRLKPTVVGERPATASSNLIVARHVAVQPLISDEGRVQLHEELQAFTPGTAEEVIDLTVNLVLALNLERASLQDLMSWGQRSQKDHGQLVHQWTKILRHESFKGAVQVVNHLHTILRSVSLENVAKVEDGGSWLPFFRSANSRSSVLEEFTHVEKEVSEAVTSLRRRRGSLQRLQEQLAAFPQRIADLARRVEAEEIVARFLGMQLQQKLQHAWETDQRAQVLEQRAVSLAQSLAEMANATHLAEMVISKHMELITAVDTVVLNSVPAWLTSYVGLKTHLAARQRPSQIAIEEVAEGLERIRNSLPTTSDE